MFSVAQNTLFLEDLYKSVQLIHGDQLWDTVERLFIYIHIFINIEYIWLDENMLHINIKGNQFQKIVMMINVSAVSNLVH